MLENNPSWCFYVRKSGSDHLLKNKRKEPYRKEGRKGVRKEGRKKEGEEKGGGEGRRKNGREYVLY